MIVNFRSILGRSFSTSESKASSRSTSFVVYCNKLITRHGRNGNVTEAESLFNRMPEKSIVSYTAMLTAYAENGHLQRSRKLFDEMPKRNLATWNAMITAYVKNMADGHEIEEAHDLFLRMPERNPLSYTVMLMGFVNAKMLDDARSFYFGMPVKWRDPFCSNVLMNGYLKTGKLEEAIHLFEGMMEKNVVSWSSMVDGYCKNGNITKAREVFDTMNVIKNEFTWCSMIDGYMKNGHFNDGLQLFLQMRIENSVKVEPTMVSAILESCGLTLRHKEGCQIHGLVSHLGFDDDTYLSNSIIGMYSKFGWINDARKLFNTLSNKDVVSWNSLISGYVQMGMVDEAYKLFEKAESKDLVSWTTILTGFATIGLIDKCIHLFNMMPEHDGIAWTALISAFLNCGRYEDAVYWFIKMMRNEVRPNPSTLTCLLCASAGLAFISLAQQLHAVVCKLQMGCDLSIHNSLMSMYSKNGDVNEAYLIFIGIPTPNIISYNTIITGFAHNGCGEQAINLFNQLVDEGKHDPNEVTFLGVLSACAHMGLVEEGRYYFKTMRSLFRVEPNCDHYASMVDLLGKAGLLEEAKELIQTMPVKPHSGVWGALLGASRMHANLDMAKFAARRIVELEPDNWVAVAVLSDLWCCWEQEVRLVKRLRGVMKSPGCSWIR